MTHFVVSSSLKRVERLEHLERLEPAKRGSGNSQRLRGEGVLCCQYLEV